MRGVLAFLALVCVTCGLGVAWASQNEAPPPPGPPAQPAQTAPPSAPAEPPPTPPAEPPPTQQVGPPEREPSRSLGKPFRKGRLVNGVPFPPEGIDHFTWDPVLKQRPNRVWRRYGADRTVHRILLALGAFRKAHPESPIIGVGDLSRPQGGEFGRRFGGLGHASHQNGLDVDVYYPRLDRRLRAPRRADQVDRELAQALVDEFVRIGATHVFVGPSLDLRGPKGVVMDLVHHDDHLHARFLP